MHRIHRGLYRNLTRGTVLAAVSSILLLSASTGCTNPNVTVSIAVEPITPYVNQLVHLTGSVVGVSSDDILEWEWEFGDGYTARGRDTWYQYRFHHEDDSGSVVPWAVQLTVTDSVGRKYVGIRNVTLHSKRATCLAGYYSRHVTTQCENEQSNRPEPTGQELRYVLDDVVVGWWDATSISSFYLLAKLFYLPDTDEARCTWRLYSRGPSKDGTPTLISEIGPDTRSVSHNASFFYSVGFPLHVDAAELFPEPGWYQFIAEAESDDGQYRDFIDFVIYVGQ